MISGDVFYLLWAAAPGCQEPRSEIEEFGIGRRRGRLAVTDGWCECHP
jgi:hypothetical protein